MSYRFHKPYLQQAVTRHGAAGAAGNINATPRRKDSAERNMEEREPYVDTILDGSFPASDPPPWTLGGPRHDQNPAH